MISRRRLSLQLTPLLDLLLIVMFSQHIENRDKVASAQEQLAVERASIATEREEGRRAIEQELSEQRKNLDQLRATYDERFRSIIDQHQQVGSLLAESLNLPGASVAEVLKLRTNGSSEDAERLTAATTQLRELMKARGEDLFRFFIKVDQMQKHVSIWELHVLDNGQATISDGEQTFSADFSSEAEFAQRMFEHSQSFADARTLIIMLLTWGDAQGGPRQRATLGMSSLAEQLRRDAAGTRWYDFSIVGFRKEGPIFNDSLPVQP